MSNIDKILDRVRKLFALADHSDNEAEAALAASRAAKLMEEYQLTEAFVRLDNPEVKAEPIVREARLEPDAPLTNRKRVAWKETISTAVAKDLGVHEFFRWHTFGGRKSADVRGFGRESAVQTWQYTCHYLWRQIDELADRDAKGQQFDRWSPSRAWKNAFRIGCAQRIAERIHENRKDANEQAKAARVTADESLPDTTNRVELALTVVKKDQAEVDAEYDVVRKGFTLPAAPSIGSTSSYSGYERGREAGEGVSLGKARAGLAAGQGRLK